MCLNCLGPGCGGVCDSPAGTSQGLKDTGEAALALAHSILPRREGERGPGGMGEAWDNSILLPPYLAEGYVWLWGFLPLATKVSMEVGGLLLGR